MFPIVASRFRSFNEPFEGVVRYMYLDVKGLVTVGVGNLIDPVELATALPFRFKKGSAIASHADIAGEWQRLKTNTALGQKGHCACERLTTLELNDDSINSLIAARLHGNEVSIKRQPTFQSFDTWPADAQLGVLSMAWAMGAGGFAGFPKFEQACKNLDFRAAAAECKLSEDGNAGVRPRNVANAILFSNAAVVLASGLDRSTLYYPRDLTVGRLS